MSSTSQQTQESDQYKEQCKNCDKVLGIDVSIMCCKHEDGDEMVLCSDCWFCWEDDWREEGWTCDEDEEEQQEEQEQGTKIESAVGGEGKA